MNLRQPMFSVPAAVTAVTVLAGCGSGGDDAGGAVPGPSETALLAVAATTPDGAGFVREFDR